MGEWKEIARNHWKTYLPVSYKELEDEGKLEEALERAEQAAMREYEVLLNQKFQPQEAKEMALGDHIFLTPELYL